MNDEANNVFTVSVDITAVIANTDDNVPIADEIMFVLIVDAVRICAAIEDAFKILIFALFVVIPAVEMFPIAPVPAVSNPVDMLFPYILSICSDCAINDDVLIIVVLMICALIELILPTVELIMVVESAPTVNADDNPNVLTASERIVPTVMVTLLTVADDRIPLAIVAVPAESVLKLPLAAAATLAAKLFVDIVLVDSELI